MRLEDSGSEVVAQRIKPLLAMPACCMSAKKVPAALLGSSLLLPKTKQRNRRWRNAWALATHGEDLDGVPGSWPQPAQAWSLQSLGSEAGMGGVSVTLPS